MSVEDHTTPVEYREIPRFVGYRFGSDGSVWSRWKKVPIGKEGGFRTILSDPWRQLRRTLNTVTGYFVIDLKPVGCESWVRFSVHRLILEAFKGPCPDGMEACHGPDRDRANCRIENLRWDTHASNMVDRDRDGFGPRGERSGVAKLDWRKVSTIRHMLSIGVTQRAIATQFDVSQSTIYLINRGRTWKSTDVDRTGDDREK